MSTQSSSSMASTQVCCRQNAPFAPRNSRVMIEHRANTRSQHLPMAKSPRLVQSKWSCLVVTRAILTSDAEQAD
jgi:hypothetical protein